MPAPSGFAQASTTKSNSTRSIAPTPSTTSGQALARKAIMRHLSFVIVRTTYRKVGRSYLTMTKDLTRVMSRIKALYRSWAIPCSGATVYAPRHRAEWLAKIPEPGVRRFRTVRKRLGVGSVGKMTVKTLVCLP